jgi:hypothetical protein
MATPRYPGANNGFLPVATKQVESYVRDPKKFKINKYVQSLRAPAPHASYWKLDRHQPARVTSDAEFAWADGAKSPSGHHNLANFALEPFQTERRAYPWSLGNQALKNAEKLGNLDLAAIHSKIVAQQAITNRTNRVITLLTTAANWNGNTASASVLNSGAGAWNFSSSVETDANAYAINKSLMEAVRRINLGTNAKVSFGDMRLLLSPGAAIAMSNSGEIRNYVKSSKYSQPTLENSMGNVNEQWGLPAHISGIEIIVEDCVIVTDKPYAGDSTEPTHSYVMPDDYAVLLSRPGAIDADFGAPSFSTLQVYWYSENGEDGGELEVEMHEPNNGWDRMMEGRCVEQFAEVLAAPPTGYLISDILS